jgi:ribosomal protein S8
MEEKRLAEEARLRKETASVTIHDYFHSIANASSVSEANMFINEAVKLFTSPDAPVLIIISQEGDIVDYDRPTTILNYLNYLKDTRNNINTVERVSYNDQGLIKELELIKNL